MNTILHVTKKRILVPLTLFALTLCTLTACGGPDISGKYTASADVSAMLNEGLKDSGIVIDKEISAPFTLELKKDKSFSMKADAAVLKENILKVMDEKSVDILKGVLKQQGITDDMIPQMLEASGYKDMESFAADMLKSFKTSMNDETMKELTKSTQISGTYKVDGTTLILNSSDGKENYLDKATLNKDGSITLPTGDKLGDIELHFTKAEEKK